MSDSDKHRTVRNRIPLRDELHFLLQRARGVPIQTDLSVYDSTLASVADLDLSSRSDAELLGDAHGLRTTLANLIRWDGDESETRATVLALVDEAASRVLGHRLYPEQTVAAIALTEGETLAAVPAAVYEVLGGRRVHVFTANDYLAGRDAAWMGDIFRMMGCSAGWITDETPVSDRRSAYQCDVTYLTSRRAGFDFLADQMAYSAAAILQPPPDTVIVDEADSLLIDESSS